MVGGKEKEERGRNKGGREGGGEREGVGREGGGGREGKRREEGGTKWGGEEQREKAK